MSDVFCASCCNMFNKNEIKQVEVNSLEKKRGIKKSILDVLVKNNFTYMACCKCNSSLIFFREVISKVQEVALENVVETQPIRSLKKFDCMCDTCHKMFVSKVSGSTRCPTCVK